MADNETTLQFNRRITKPGLYFIHVDDIETRDNGTIITQSDTIAIMAENKVVFDAKLQGKWLMMKDKLGASNTSDALKSFSRGSRETYEKIFTDLTAQLPNIVADMQDIEMIYTYEHQAKYRIRRVHNIDGENVTITYYIYFTKDADGLWRIESW